MPYKEPEEQESPLLELETWKEIIQSDGWKYFKELLDGHKKYLEWQVLVAVSNKKFDEASDYSSRTSECSNILRLVDGRLTELRKEK